MQGPLLERGMALLEVLKYPDPRLREMCSPVSFQEQAPGQFLVPEELKVLAQDMLETMYEEGGIGLAAAQVGQKIRLLVMDTRPRKDEDQTDLETQLSQPIVIFNPEIVKTEGKTKWEEGCLSVPSYYETVDRFDKVWVKGVGLDGKVMNLELDGLSSICMQHEIDHLDGKLFVDRLSFVKASRIKSKIQKWGYPEKKRELNREDS